MSVMTEVCAWITKNPGRQFKTRDVVAMLGLKTDQVSNALRLLADVGALQIVEVNHGRGGHVYGVADPEQIRTKSFGDLSRPIEEPTANEPEYLTFAVDHDGDLQMVRPDGSMALMLDNANARRLVGFVSLHATAILMAGNA